NRLLDLGLGRTRRKAGARCIDAEHDIERRVADVGKANDLRLGHVAGGVELLDGAPRPARIPEQSCSPSVQQRLRSSPWAAGAWPAGREAQVGIAKNDRAMKRRDAAARHAQDLK